MGECRYYMRARWESTRKAEEALPWVSILLQRMAEAEDYWQEIRGHRTPSPEERYRDIAEKYHDVLEAIEFDPSQTIDAGLNVFAGMIDSPYRDPDSEISQLDDEIMFSGVVWHMADWDGLAVAMRKLGAIGVGWVSEETLNMDPYSQIELE